MFSLSSISPFFASPHFTNIAKPVCFFIARTYDGLHTPELPSFLDTAEEMVTSAREDINVLVEETSERLRGLESDNVQQNARIDEASARYESNLIAMEQATAELDEAVDVVVALRDENTDELERVIKTQVETQASLESQQTMVQSIAASLENLPELLLINREMQALRVENARLALERDNYDARVDSLLSALDEKDEVNEQLQSRVDVLDGQVSGLTSRMDTLLAFAQNMQRQNDELRAQLSEKGTENRGSHFSLNLFS